MAEATYKETSCEPESSNPKARKDTICEGCKEKASKYKCPGCSIRSCSLPCVKAHKQSTGCTGKKPLAQIIPLSKFDDNLLISDYNLLEDVKRVADSAQRKRAKLCGDGENRLPHPHPHKFLRKAAASRRTKIIFHPTGMSKRQMNQSFYDCRKKAISWTIEWRFHSTDVVLHDHGVDENTSLSSVIMNHLQPGPWNHRLKRFCEEPLQSLKFFVRKFAKGSKSPFLELDIDAPIRQQLANLVIIEYPVIHVFLPWHHYDFAVIKAAIRHKLDPKKSIENREQSPKGVPFKEEEIKDENDPKVLDLMNYGKKNFVDKFSHQPTGTEEQVIDKKDSLCATASEKVIKINICSVKAEDEQLDFSINSTVADLLEKMDFDFEQELIDSYSDLISESNLDEVFDLDGVLLTEKNDQLPIEELEEGEISG
ncbi:putative box C/D snoRNA protein SPCC613.07 [Apium graveolens]|uniref:putative box C/D snoRNA protein SPCC613.07 n=1 Tax=Apium graveolens TaxID=4045 RepID=UPI003D790E8D